MIHTEENLLITCYPINLIIDDPQLKRSSISDYMLPSQFVISSKMLMSHYWVDVTKSKCQTMILPDI